MDKFSPDALEITGLTEEIIKTHGQPREKTLIEFEEFYNECVENGYVVVGHNILGFDGKFLTAEYKRIGKEFNVPHSAIDTGLIVKAAQLDLWPDDYESFRDFLLRVADIRARGIYWKLSGFCDEQFGLNDWLEDEEANTFVKQAHDAGADCLKVHLLLRRFKEYSNMISNGDVTIVEVDGAELFEELRQLCQSSCI
jgi:hypothetical protein